jgi:hypothetical protein
MTIQAFKRRFDELLSQLGEIDKTRVKPRQGSVRVDEGLLLMWRVKARNLLSQSCGAGSEHYREFQRVEEDPGYSSYSFMQRLMAVFLAAKEDYEGGYTRSIRSLVHAELFDDELEQAKELLTAGYKAPSAVIARVVLETTLRKLCGDRNIGVGKLDKMNADLAKDDLYDTLVQKRVTMLADIGNKAAHGDTSFTHDDVRGMIADIERFVSDYPVA